MHYVVCHYKSRRCFLRADEEQPDLGSLAFAFNSISFLCALCILVYVLATSDPTSTPYYFRSYFHSPVSFCSPAWLGCPSPHSRAAWPRVDLIPRWSWCWPSRSCWTAGRTVSGAKCPGGMLQGGSDADTTAGLDPAMHRTAGSGGIPRGAPSAWCGFSHGTRTTSGCPLWPLGTCNGSWSPYLPVAYLFGAFWAWISGALVGSRGF